MLYVKSDNFEDVSVVGDKKNHCKLVSYGF